MSEFWINFLTQQAPLIASLFTAIIGLILTALKYKKQKYEIAILQEQNKAAAMSSSVLSAEEIHAIKAIIEKVKKE